MLGVFLEVVLPVALVAALGGVVGRWLKLSAEAPSALVFYLFGPALVFHSMATTRLSAGVSLRIVGVMTVTFGAMYAAASLWSTARGHDPSMRAGFALGATSPNIGNMGLPVAQLAFGDAGLEVAVMNFVAGAVLVHTAGIAIASAAGASQARALGAPLRSPLLYAAAAGLAVNVFALELPTAVRAAAESLAAATIPTMLVVLGLQIRHAAGGGGLVDLAAVNAGRLLLAPVIAWFTATGLGLDGVTRSTLVVLAAMPTAVITMILAVQFKAQPAFLARVVVTSTIVGILTLTLLISLVR